MLWKQLDYQKNQDWTWHHRMNIELALSHLQIQNLGEQYNEGL